MRIENLVNADLRYVEEIKCSEEFFNELKKLDGFIINLSEGEITGAYKDVKVEIDATIFNEDECNLVYCSCKDQYIKFICNLDKRVKELEEKVIVDSKKGIQIINAKEVVLNNEDTKAILSAVDICRDININKDIPIVIINITTSNQAEEMINQIKESLKKLDGINKY